MHRHGDQLHEHDHDHAGHDHSHGLGHSAIDAAHLWELDNVVLSTVGIDVGSSTSHFMFGRVHLRRDGAGASSRYAVVSREIVWRSPVRLTPYRADDTIDAEALAVFVADGYRAAGVAPSAIDAGAVILTGEALKRHNARALAERFAAQSGAFVCASAGHHLEAVLAAHGSGAVARSRSTGATLLNIDMGGGTTKFARIVKGQVEATAAIAVGARLIVCDAGGRIVRLESPAVELAAELGIGLQLGDVLLPAERSRIVGRMIGLVLALVRHEPPDPLARRLLLTQAWDDVLPIDAVTVSGGVAEFLYERESRDFGDLGRDLAAALRAGLAAGGGATAELEQGIRATVIGASQFTVQLSGNTILISSPERLPLRNIPVVRCRFDLQGAVDEQAIAGTARAALARIEGQDPGQPVAVAFDWQGAPSFARLSALARGLCAALAPRIAAGAPIVLAIDGDVALNLGRLLRFEIAPGAEVIAIDGLQLADLDYVDVGAMLEPACVVPVTIKSLLF